MKEQPPKGIHRLGFKTGERKTTARGRTPIDTYPPTVDIPIVSNRTLAPEAPPSSPPPAPTRIEEPENPERPVKKGLRSKFPKSWLIRGALAAAAIGGTSYAGVEAYQHLAGEEQKADSSFTEHLKAGDFFDPKATKGVITDKNTIQMTREEYAKIAPPVINRENVRKVPGEVNLGGGRVRKLTFERGTSVNAMIYIKTPEGTIRNVTYTKIVDPGKLTGDVFPNCEVFVGKKNEIQAGDTFPSPISGKVLHSGRPQEHYKGEKLEEGATVSDNYRIEGEYVDKKGNRFKVHASINTLGLSGSAITKAVIPGIPNSHDFLERGSNGGRITNTEKLNKARVEVKQGDDLFKFITPPPFQHFSPASPTQSQVLISVSYQGDFGENGIANTFGGEDCNHPTLDNKAIVLK